MGAVCSSSLHSAADVVPWTPEARGYKFKEDGEWARVLGTPVERLRLVASATPLPLVLAEIVGEFDPKSLLDLCLQTFGADQMRVITPALVSANPITALGRWIAIPKNTTPESTKARFASPSTSGCIDFGFRMLCTRAQ